MTPQPFCNDVTPNNPCSDCLTKVAILDTAAPAPSPTSTLNIRLTPMTPVTPSVASLARPGRLLTILNAVGPSPRPTDHHHVVIIGTFAPG
ncbi:hypothetical protein BC936DRAFT_142011 [Jimgerdemannia flammicorona]|uniref:Uncharacterized protein n=1 Tax=Jimgerdemannia flammicorona TaxID=994334 RepID=A0A433DFL8_9FUNG|nr:hypothetical protein BC936DRAFT_142011 [Jimgerdemannia flammicorona]